MNDQIIDKLSDLSEELPFTKECQVVYLFVETRKLLERADQPIEYDYIRFFCDWVLHTEKTRNLEVIRDDFEKIAADLELQEKKSIIQSIMDLSERPISQFADFVKLRIQLGKFFQKKGVANSFTTDDSNWYSLRNLLFRILADQMIDFQDNPVRGIKSMRFSDIRKDLFGCFLDVEFIENGVIKKKRYAFADHQPNFKIFK